MNKSLTLLLVASLVITVGIIKVRGIDAKKIDNHPERNSPEIYYIASGIENAREGLRCFRFSATYNESNKVSRSVSISEDGRPIVTKSPGSSFSDKVYLHCNGSELLMLIDHEGKDKAPPYVEQLIANGDEASIFSEYRILINEKSNQIKFKREAAIVPRDTTVEDGLWEGHYFWDPRSYVYAAGSTPLDKFFLHTNPAVVYIGREKWQGSQCVKLMYAPNPNKQLVYWIDTDHGFMLRRLDSHSMMNGQMVLAGQMEVPRLIEDKGFWFPAVIESISYDVNIHGNEEVVKSTPSSVRRLTVNEFHADCDEKSKVFNAQFPVGTFVNDNIRQLSMQVVAVEKRSLEIYNQKLKMKGDTELKFIPVSEEELKELNEERKRDGDPALKDPIAVTIEVNKLKSLVGK